jgi:orotidine-5'-phosphate decarboxylase
MTSQRPRLIVALDLSSLPDAVAMAQRLAGVADMFKVGLELFSAEGPAALRAIADIGPVFYDAKLLDIPNTVAGAAANITAAGVAMFNVHATGGLEMMRAAVAAAGDKSTELEAARPLILGVTVLTSISEHGLQELGVARSMCEQVVALARMARDSGLDGVVASPHEIADIKQACGADFLVVTPGVRPAWAESDDQKRVMTPREAAAAGADFIVVGRPITRSQSPADAARRVLQELSGE